ncbi:MAG: endonuclease III [Candidatus Sumerlaeia bacterium]|nr:endonuclease III [Candidatus Sumerlaeia bacterium]
MGRQAEQLKERTEKINRLLKKQYPKARIELEFSTPFELLIATILSAQSTDKRVNEVTKTLFKKYKTPEDYVKAPQAELEKDIKSTGFYRQKAKTLKACCQKLIEKFNGEVPQTIEEMTTLPGVGRKTANMVLGNAFGIPGITVDRHVMRVVNRLELSKQTDPEKIELELQNLIPRTDWVQFSNALILHGRYVCTAQKPACERCVLSPYCPFPAKTEND